MYNKYFGFRESPFSVTPDPRFLYTNDLYQEALATLLYGIEGKKGFIVVTGEAGTGKTTLLRKLMRSLETTIHSVFIFNTHFDFTELLQVTMHDLGLTPPGNDRLAMIEELNRYLIEQLKRRHVVCLLIDEAQNLTAETLEGLRLLSNLETDKEKLLQIVLMGQPELEAKLDQPALRQLKQRVALHSRLLPLNETEIGSYINFRLQVAGYQGDDDLFAAEARERIAFYSRGIPRLINIICDNALLIAYAASKKIVTQPMIKEAADDLGIKPQSPRIPENVTPTGFSETKANPGDYKPQDRWNRMGSRGLASLLAVSLLVAAISLDAVLNVKNLLGSLFNPPRARAAYGLFTPLPAEEPQDMTKNMLSPREPHRVEISLNDPPGREVEDPPRPVPLNPRQFRPEPRETAIQEESPVETYDVVRTSFVRNTPRSNADIIATLRPRMQVKVVRTIGNYYQVQSMDNGTIRGYVHREDAFFAPSKNGR